MNDLSTTQGIVAVAGVALGLLALIACAVLASKLRRMRSAQAAVLGEHDEATDLVAHAERLALEFAALRAGMEEAAGRLDARMSAAELRLDGAVAYAGLVRYDAYGEMSGHQSTSIALLDAGRSGVVLSSIHHRDQARLYAKQVRHGLSELELSPEELEAIGAAMRADALAPPADAAGPAA